MGIFPLILATLAQAFKDTNSEKYFTPVGSTYKLFNILSLVFLGSKEVAYTEYGSVGFVSVAQLTMLSRTYSKCTRVS